MIDLKNLKRAIEQVAEEKHIDASKVLEAIESAIAAAYKKEYEKRSEFVKVKFDLKTGALAFAQVKTVVDPTTVRMPSEEEKAAFAAGERPPASGEAWKGPPPRDERAEKSEEERLPRYNPDRHILIEEARALQPGAKLGDEIEFPLEPHGDFGRIAAQTAKQVILQRLREAERDSVMKEFENKEGEIVSGTVQRFERGNVIADVGRAAGIMFPNEAIPGEHYRPGERLRFLVVAIQPEGRMPGIILSRSHPKFVSRLFALEVPEFGEGMIEVKAIAREPGSRTKIAVASHAAGVDPVGSCVGQRGSRVMAVSNELGQEKIDIIEWAEDPAKFVGNSLSPAKADGVEILPKREARVLVPEDQLSLAIGKGGQNVRLAAKLTGWKIDVRSSSRPEEEQEAGVAASPEDAGLPPGAVVEKTHDDE